MNFKFAVFLLFIGASSASFLLETSSNVVVKRRFETISSPILKAVQKKAAEKDIIDDLLAVLAQIIAEFEILGEAITPTLLEDLQNLLADLELIGGDILNQVLEILGSYIDQLPQVVIDILAELGLLPKIGKDIIDDLLAVLAQILAEVEILGEIITPTLLEDLQNLLADLELIGGDILSQVLEILGSYIDQLPQVVIDILAELGLLPKIGKDIIDDLLAVLAQIIAEVEILGEIITPTLLEDLQNLLADLELIGGDIIAQVVAILETYIDQLPQVVIDILQQLGLLPKSGVNKQDDIIDDLLAVLAQILAEFELFGDVITATLLEDLQSLLVDLEAIGGDIIAQVVAILESYIDQLPQVVIDILQQLGLLPKIKVQAQLAIQALKKALSAKDIWSDLVDALMLQLVQILADLESWGIDVSDDVLAQIENLILAVMAEGGQAWEVLQAMLEQYAIELQEVLGDLLAQIGILPKTSAIKSIKATKDIFDDIFNALMQIVAQLEEFGSIVSDELIETFTNLLLDLQGVSDEAFQLVVALLEQYAELLYDQFGDLLEQLGITVPPLATPATSELLVARDIIDDIFAVLDQILAEIDTIGSVSD